jgi:hypothetical protein
MRYSLVILYFVALHVILRPASPPDLADRAVSQAPASAQVSRTADITTEEPVRRELPALAASAQTADLPTQTLSLLPSITDSTGAVEGAGEQSASVDAAPPIAGDRGVAIHLLVQRELVRLACLANAPEPKWGKKSRAALRRFAARAKRKQAPSPDEALLRMLRSYPADYCRLCRPGQTACNIERKAKGSPRKRSENMPAHQPADDAAVSYLPPWMQSGRLAEADDGAVQSDAAEAPIPPAPKVKNTRRRAASGLSWPRQASPSRRRMN